MYIITVEKKEQVQQPVQQSPIKRNANFKTINEALQPDTYHINEDILQNATNRLDIFQDLIEFLDDIDSSFLAKDVLTIQEKLFDICERIKELDDFVVEHVIEE